MEVNEEFLRQLKETLMALDKRQTVIEHLVNDVIINGYKDAAEKLTDDENYSVFVDTYKPEFEPYEEFARTLHADEEDYDLGSSLYDSVKALDHNAEGFDEKAEVMRLLDELKSQIEETKTKAEQLVSDLSAKEEEPKSEVEVKEEIKEDGDKEDEIDDESEEFWSQPDALKKFRERHNIRGDK